MTQSFYLYCLYISEFLWPVYCHTYFTKRRTLRSLGEKKFLQDNESLDCFFALCKFTHRPMTLVFIRLADVTVSKWCLSNDCLSQSSSLVVAWAHLQIIWPLCEWEATHNGHLGYTMHTTNGVVEKKNDRKCLKCVGDCCPTEIVLNEKKAFLFGNNITMADFSY